MFGKILTFISIVPAILLLLAGCTEDYPEIPTLRQDFQASAARRLPANVEVTSIETYRGDGDSHSFTQIFVFDVKASRKVLISDGWLKGSVLGPEDKFRRLKVELVYHKRDGQWVAVGDSVL